MKVSLKDIAGVGHKSEDRRLGIFVTSSQHGIVLLNRDASTGEIAFSGSNSTHGPLPRLR